LERTKQMAHVNELYQEGDLAGLQRFLDQLEGLSTATDMGTGPSRVALLRMQLKQVTLRIAQVRSELEALRHSPLGRLSEQIALARTRGRELLDEMAAEIDVQIATLRRHLAACHNDGVQA
jgi:hypothetical protein